MGKILAFLIGLILTLIILNLIGCSSPETTSGINTVPASGWESIMKAVAKTNWFGTFCLLSFFGGVVAVGLDQRKIGGAVIIAAIATLCLGLAIHRFPTWLAIMGFAGSIIAAGYSILIKNKALVEIIEGVQEYRDKTIEHDEIDHNLLINQSQSTKKIVKKIKEKNGNTNTG